jgi:RNA polymerase sigma-70 factor (ECF subfamily)
MSMALAAPIPLPARRPRKRRAPALDSRSEPSDETLLLRIGRADREAFGALFTRYAPRVKSYLMRLGAAAAAAEDIAQDAMLSVWRRAGSYDPAKAKPSTWVFVIARNAWIDRLRREKVELAYSTENPATDVSDAEAPDAAVARADDEARIGEALAALPEEQRQVVRLSFFEDRPHSEIAERLSLPLGTVKSRLRLALIKLRAHWELLS